MPVIVKHLRASAFIAAFASLLSLDCFAIDGIDRRFGNLGALGLPPAPVTHREMTPNAIAIQPDGKLILGGYVDGPGVLPAVGRIDRQGVWDETFGDHGISVLPSGSAAAPFGGQVTSLALLSDQRVVFSGSAESGGGALKSCSLIGALSPTGVLDAGFNTSGAFCYEMPGVDIGGNYIFLVDKLLVDAQDRLYLTTNHASQPGGVARFTSQGVIDTSFGTQGVASLGQGNVGDTLLLPGDGNLYVGAYHPYGASAPSDSSVRVYKFSLDGAIDNSFGTGGAASYGDAQNQFVAETLNRDDQGRLVLGFSQYQLGNSEAVYHSFQLARFTPTGNLDSSFNAIGQQPGIAGVALTSTLIPWENRVYKTQMNTDGSILMVGRSTFQDTSDLQNWPFLVRLFDDASFDPAFGTNATPGRIQAPLLSTDFRVTGATQESASSMLVVGFNFAAAPSCRGVIMRLITDQTFNDSFESNDIPITCPSAP
jgi:uncharacterized delta-60 repeat protein